MAEEPRTEEQMRKSAELVVDVCFAVKEGDVVTIITDNRRKEEADMVATVVYPSSPPHRKQWSLPVVLPGKIKM